MIILVSIIIGLARKTKKSEPTKKEEKKTHLFISSKYSKYRIISETKDIAVQTFVF